MTVAQISGVKLKLKGLNEVMRSPGVQAKVDQVGRAIAAAAGDGFEYNASPHKWTARGYISARTAEARRAEANNRVLLSALSAGRGL